MKLFLGPTVLPPLPQRFALKKNPGKDKGGDVKFAATVNHSSYNKGDPKAQEDLDVVKKGNIIKRGE